LVDILSFQYITFAGTSRISELFAIGGFITPPFAILAFLGVRKFFKNVEEANVIHLMNLLS
ncbi:MAG: hypothetical protein ACW98I_18870, partial [Candidatus Hodarchaeales archaeon]